MASEVAPKILGIGCGGAGLNILQAAARVTRISSLVGFNSESRHGIPKSIVSTTTSVRGLAHSSPEVLRSTTLSPGKELREVIGQANFVVGWAGLGGDFGGAGIRLVARLCQVQRALHLSIVTLPFGTESPNRRGKAQEDLKALVAESSVLALGNDGLTELAPNLAFSQAFRVLDHFMVKPVEYLAQGLGTPDLSKLRGIFVPGLLWYLGSGDGSGYSAEEVAVREALRSPWLKDRTGAQDVLLLVAAREPHPVTTKQVADQLEEQLHPKAVYPISLEDPNVEGVRAMLLVSYPSTDLPK